MAESQEDRRRHQRHKIDRSARIKGAGGGDGASGRTSDISLSGMGLEGFEAPHGFGEGDEIVVEIESGGEGGDGKVVRAGRVVRAVEDFVAVSFEDFYEHEELAELGIGVDRDMMFN